MKVIFETRMFTRVFADVKESIPLDMMKELLEEYVEAKIELDGSRSILVNYSPYEEVRIVNSTVSANSEERFSFTFNNEIEANAAHCVEIINVLIDGDILTGKMDIVTYPEECTVDGQPIEVYNHFYSIETGITPEVFKSAQRDAIVSWAYKIR